MKSRVNFGLIGSIVLFLLGLAFVIISLVGIFT